MHSIISSQKSDFESALQHLSRELSQLRTGRASPAIVEDVQVEAYGALQPIKAVGSISTLDARTLAIEPWDKSLVRAIEKGIQVANLGLNPAVDGSVIRLAMPALTEESRKQLVKRMKEMLEEARVRIRGVREQVKSTILQAEKEKEMSEDERFQALEDLEKMTKEFVSDVETMGAEKEKEIMTV